VPTGGRTDAAAPVAIFGSSRFDARTTDPLTVALAGSPIKLNPQGKPSASLQDINGDGRLDLVVRQGELGGIRPLNNKYGRAISESE